MNVPFKPEQLEIVRKAALILDRKESNFVRRAAVEKGKRVIAKNQTRKEECKTS